MNSDSDSTLPSTVAPAIAHIQECLARHRASFFVADRDAASVAGAGARMLGGSNDESRLRLHPPPLFVAVQGPQGAGKTYLACLLRTLLAAPPYALRTAVLSIDDLYRPHAELHALATARHPGNALMAGRGLPGTHDVRLGLDVLRRLRRMNERSVVEAETDADALREESGGGGAGGITERGREEVHLPVYDKSAHGGLGDRVTAGSARGETTAGRDDDAVVRAPLDVLLFEGWCVGFYPLRSADLASRLAQAREGTIPDLQNGLDWEGVKEADVRVVNAYLGEYVEMWEMFDAFVQIKPPDATPYSPIYKWRLEQEHYMKAQNGGRGMDDWQVKTFVDRYIPGYVLFGEGIEGGYVDEEGVEHRPRWVGQGLKMVIDERRELVRTEHF